MFTPVFFFSLFALLVYLFSGFYFLYLWLRTGRRFPFLLLWAYGFGTILLFKVPNILTNAHAGIVQYNLYPFFFVTLLLHFLAYSALIFGLIPFRGFSLKKHFIYFLLVWFAGSVAYYFLSFFVEGFDVTYAPVWAGHLLFFIPVQICLLFRLWRVWQWSSSPSRRISRSGVILAVLGTLALTGTSVLYIVTQVSVLQRHYWYYSVVSSSWISILQIVSGVLLFLGLRALVRSRFGHAS